MAKQHDWDALTTDILSRLDLAAAYRDLGVDIVGEPNAAGWASARAVGREDRTPSAAVNVRTGRYRDFGGGGQSLGLFDFAATHGPHGDWRAARAHFASVAGVAVPDATDQRADDLFTFHPPRGTVILRWCQRKPPITPDAVLLAGAMLANWPRILPADQRQLLITWPMWGGLGIDGDPTGYHSVRSDGQPIRLKDSQAAKMSKGRIGLLNRHALAHMGQASVVWVVEGITSMLALQTVLGDRTDHVATSVGGASALPPDGCKAMFAGKDVRLVFDLDAPANGHVDGAGQLGAAKWVVWLSGSAAVIRNVRLPGQAPLDLRDWLGQGHTYDQLLQRSEATEPARQVVAFGKVSNAIVIRDESGMTKEARRPSETFGDLQKVTGGWPQRVDDALFVDRGGEAIWFRTTPKLFAWMHSVADVDWHSMTNAITKEEFRALCEQTARNYGRVEQYPHFPPLKDHYYLCHQDIPSGDGSTIRELIDRFFQPQTPQDWDLLHATIVTLFWGGPYGTRPAFMFSSKDGRGSGKTVTMAAIASICGGTVDTERDEQMRDFKTRLLTPETDTAKRVVSIDNIKTERFSWGALEQIITASHISGRRLYKGEGSTPNTFLWFLTINGPSLSRDIAQRVIIIALRKPQYTATWHRDSKQFIEDRRWDIIADAKGYFERAIPDTFEPRTRWATWETEVIGRLPDPASVQQVIVDRQHLLDDEVETAGEIESHFASKLEGLGYDPERDVVYIEIGRATEWFREASDEPFLTKSKVRRRIRQCAGEGTFQYLSDLNLRIRIGDSRSRGVLWLPQVSGRSELISDGEKLLSVICRDLEDRIRF